MRLGLLACSSMLAIAFLSLPAHAQEATNYQYDAQGRLIGSATGGGPNNGVTRATCFDAMGNRVRYFSGTGGLPACAIPTPIPTIAPTPTPTPTPTNSPPVAVADNKSLICFSSTTLNVLSNDYDPDGNVPLSLVSVSAGAYVINSTTVQIDSEWPGNLVFSYVVADSLGATATGTVSVTVTGTQKVCEIRSGEF